MPPPRRSEATAKAWRKACAENRGRVSPRLRAAASAACRARVVPEHERHIRTQPFRPPSKDCPSLIAERQRPHPAAFGARQAESRASIKHLVPGEARRLADAQPCGEEEAEQVAEDIRGIEAPDGRQWGEDLEWRSDTAGCVVTPRKRQVQFRNP